MGTCAAAWHDTPCAMMQYNPAPGSHGSVKFLYARIADIFMGTIITSLFTLVLPWSVPPPHQPLHLPSAFCSLAFSSLSLAFSSPSTCLQQPLHLPSAVTPLAFNNPSACIQQSHRLPSATPSLVFSTPPFAFSTSPTCLQPSLLLPSLPPHLPSTALLLASATLPLAFNCPFSEEVHMILVKVCGM